MFNTFWFISIYVSIRRGKVYTSVYTISRLFVMCLFTLIFRKEVLYMENMDQQEKTFTQDEVNKIVSDRLGREKERYEKDYQAKAEELRQQELRIKGTEFLKSHHLSEEMYDILKFSNTEELETSILSLKKALQGTHRELGPTGVTPGETRSILTALAENKQADVTEDPIRKGMGL